MIVKIINLICHRYVYIITFIKTELLNEHSSQCLQINNSLPSLLVYTGLALIMALKKVKQKKKRITLNSKIFICNNWALALVEITETKCAISDIP